MMMMTMLYCSALAEPLLSSITWDAPGETAAVPSPRRAAIGSLGSVQWQSRDGDEHASEGADDRAAVRGQDGGQDRSSVATLESDSSGAGSVVSGTAGTGPPVPGTSVFRELDSVSRGATGEPPVFTAPRRRRHGVCVRLMHSLQHRLGGTFGYFLAVVTLFLWTAAFPSLLALPPLLWAAVRLVTVPRAIRHRSLVASVSALGFLVVFLFGVVCVRDCMLCAISTLPCHSRPLPLLFLSMQWSPTRAGIEAKLGHVVLRHGGSASTSPPFTP
jgi:hypothetical protein